MYDVLFPSRGQGPPEKKLVVSLRPPQNPTLGGTVICSRLVRCVPTFRRLVYPPSPVPFSQERRLGTSQLLKGDEPLSQCYVKSPPLHRFTGV